MLVDLYDYLKRTIIILNEKQLRRLKRDLQGICFLIDQQLKKAN